MFFFFCGSQDCQHEGHAPNFLHRQKAVVHGDSETAALYLHQLERHNNNLATQSLGGKAASLGE